MSVIEPLKQQLDQLVTEMSAFPNRQFPYQQLSDDDDKLHKLLQKMDNLQDNTNKRIKDIDNEMSAILGQSIEVSDTINTILAYNTRLTENYIMLYYGFTLIQAGQPVD